MYLYLNYTRKYKAKTIQLLKNHNIIDILKSININGLIV